MSAGDRFKGWVEGLAGDWKERLAGWMVGWFAGGANTFAERLEPGLKDMASASIAQLMANPAVPQELKDQLAHAMKAGNILETILIEFIMIIQAIPVLLGGSQPLARNLEYLQDRIKQTFRLDPASVITAWRRDPAKYAALFEDLRDLGWTEQRIEALKFVSQFIPSPRDLVDWQAKEVFEPAMVAKYGLDDEFGQLDLSLFAKVGVSEEQALNFWRAHWEHASWNQVIEMLHRGLMTEQDVRDWFRLVEIPPYWRDKLIGSAWNVPTRVDVRRFWDMRTIDEARLREIYTAQGYRGKDLDDYVIWTKVYTDFPTLLARWKNGWITLDQVRERLVALGMPADRAEEMLQEKIQAEGAERTSAERSLTLTDIYKGVKQGRITRAEAVGLVMDLGYDQDEAGFKLDVNIPSDNEDSAVRQRQLAKADVLKGLKAGIITRDGARQLLLQLRYSAVDVEFLLKLFDATITPPTELKLKEASKADIILGVKRGIITPEEGYAMLLDLDFAPEAADFILAVRVEESPFSPVTFDEFRDRTQRWRIAAGMEGKPMTEEIKRLGADMVRRQAEAEVLRKAIAEEKSKTIDEVNLPATATARIRELQAVLYKAEAEMQRVQTDYRVKVEEWRHGRK